MSAAMFCLATPAVAQEVGFSVHAEGAVAHTVDGRTDPFGWGASALVAPELELGHKLGFELPLGIVGFAGAASQGAMVAHTSGGSAFFVMPGVRLRPFAGPRAGLGDRLWIAGGAGITDTGGVVGPSVDVRLGADLGLGRVALGPFAGFLQIVNTHGGLRPDDARVLMAGLHWTLGRHDPVQPAAGGDRDRVVTPEAPTTPVEDTAARVVKTCPNERDCGTDAPGPVVANAPLVIADQLQFALGRAVLPATAQPVLRDIAKLLGDHVEIESVRIVGHADESGGDAYNLHLSEMRARAVKAALVRLGVSADRLEVAFFGKSRPRRHERSAEAQRENRRVEFEISGRRTP